MMRVMKVKLTLMMMISLVIINIFCHTSSQGLEIFKTLILDPAP